MTNPDFLSDFAQMSTFGATERGGIDRQAGTVDDVGVRNWFSEWLRSNGFEVEFDAIGNQYGLRELNPDAPWVVVGSHMDSQPLGGRFDGSYGVLCGAHAINTLAKLAEAGELETTYNLAVVNWFNEEGSRFTPSMMGSNVFSGKADLQTAYETKDLHGITVQEELEKAGFIGSFELGEVACYAEIHVEQGRILDDEGISIGLVDGTWGAKKWMVTVKGDQSHSGSTLLVDRHDALFGASIVISEVQRYAYSLKDTTPLQYSIASMEVLPNSPITVAREVRMNLDFRSPERSTLETAEKKLAELISAAEEEAKVEIHLDKTHEWDLAPYHPEGVDLAREVAEEIGLSHRNIQTIAGHDSTNMKDLVPTIMLFIPSVDGISHNEKELTTNEDMLMGVDYFTKVVARMARGELNH